MATVTKTGIDSWEVAGAVCTLNVLVSLDDVNGALYRIYNEEDDRVGIRADLDAAIELAEQIADNGDPQEGPEAPTTEEV